MSKLRRFIPLIIIAIAGLLFFWFDLGRFFSFEVLRDYKSDLLMYVDSHLTLAVIILVLVYMLAVAFSAPIATYLTLLSGFLFGPWIGVPAVLVGATLGACILFLAARGALADFFRKKTGAWFDKFAEGFKKDAFAYILFLRLTPVFPFFVVNVVPAFFSVRLSTYALATLIGIFPGTTILILIGQSLGAIIDEGGDVKTLLAEYPEVSIALAGLALLSIIPLLIKKFRRAR